MKISSLLVLVVLFPFMACHSSQTSQDSGYVSRDDDRWDTRSIDICFTQINPQLDRARSIIVQGLNEEYGKVGFRFNAQASCGMANAIRVTFINGAASQVDEIGSGVRTVSMGVGHSCWDASGRAINYLDSNCVRNVAIHEFGHALGLHHEMNRRDNDDQCNQDQTHGMGEYGAIQLGDYDNTSVMNYCQVLRLNDNNSRMPLSQGDIQTLKAIYQGPVANVDRLPSAVLGSPDQISFKVIGTDVTEFQLKFGPRNAIDCKQSAGYSPFLPVSYPNTGAEMVREFLGEDARVSGDYRICLIARNGSKTQSYTSYSSIDIGFP